MISKIITKVYGIYFLTVFEKKLFNHFYKRKKKCDNKFDLVLVQCVEDYFYFGLFGEIILSLKEKKNIKVEQYIVRNLTLGSTSSIRNFLISILFSNRFRDNKWIKLYSSYCDDIAYRHEGSTNIIFDISTWFKAYKIYKNIKTKKQLLSLEIDAVKVGDLIYDSYLRFKPAPTVDIDDFYLCIVIWQSIRNIHMTNQYFNEKKPFLLLTSYSTYIQHGIAVRIATKFDTKIYSFGNFQTFTKNLTEDDCYHSSNYKKYNIIFNDLPHKELNLKKARIALESKLGGKIDTSIAYMKTSAYELSDAEIPNVKDHVVVFLHDFYDSPHVYGNMVFNDFLEWIEFSIEIFEKFNIPYCLKPHPNQISDSQKVIDNLKVKYKNLNFISSNITNKQLVDGGIKVGISVYGTVAHELVYMGVPIILCAENPHSSYNFCFEAKNKEEYTNFIANYEKLDIIQEYRTEIESFYYMHNLNSSDEMKVLMNDFVHLFYKNYSLVYDVSYFKVISNMCKNKEFKLFIKNL